MPPDERPAATGDELELGILPQLVGYHLRLAQVAVFRDFTLRLEDFAMSPGRFGLLALIEANPGLTQARLAKAIRLDRSTMVPVLDRLEAAGYVERRPAPGDRRSNGVWLTAQGSALLRRMQRPVAEHERRMLVGFTAREKRRLIELLQRIRYNLSNS
jgi:DNA-binding MarR family transcriptional regulator